MPERPVKQRLIEAAFALFEDRGYERTTVDDIAERAGVSRATFFRTFRSKEDAIFPDHDAMLADVQARLTGATQQTALIAVAEAVRLVLLHYVEEGALARNRYRLTRSVPALRDREIASTHQYQRLFRTFIHHWLGNSAETALKAELMAAAVVAAHNHVLRRWLRGLTQQPDAEFDAAMARTLDLFTERDQNAGKSTVVVLHTTRNLDEVLPRLRTLLDEPS
jgi:AcrR family transcriptional regulator